MNDDPKQLRERFTPKQAKVIKLDRQMCTVRFSHCGKVLAAGGTDGSVRRWDASGDALSDLPSLTGHGGWVQAIAFHPDGQRLFTSDSWGELRCWPYTEKGSTPQWAVKEAHDGWIRALVLSPDGKHLATCGRDQKIRLFTVGDGSKAAELAGGPEDLLSLAFHPDGQSLVCGDMKGNVRQWDLASGKCVREIDARALYRLERLQDIGGVRGLIFDAKGTTLACAGMQPKNGGNVQGIPTALFFDWQSGKLQHTVTIGNDGDGYIYDLHFHPAGFVMAVTSGNPGVGKFFFQRPGDNAPFFQTALANCHSLAVHPNGQRLVVCATNANSAGNGRLLDKNKEYPGNWSPLHVWDLPKA